MVCAARHTTHTKHAHDTCYNPSLLSTFPHLPFPFSRRVWFDPNAHLPTLARVATAHCSSGGAFHTTLFARTPHRTRGNRATGAAARWPYLFWTRGDLCSTRTPRGVWVEARGLKHVALAPLTSAPRQTNLLMVYEPGCAGRPTSPPYDLSLPYADVRAFRRALPRRRGRSATTGRAVVPHDNDMGRHLRRTLPTPPLPLHAAYGTLSALRFVRILRGTRDPPVPGCATTPTPYSGGPGQTCLGPHLTAGQETPTTHASPGGIRHSLPTRHYGSDRSRCPPFTTFPLPLYNQARAYAHAAPRHVHLPAAAAYGARDACSKNHLTFAHIFWLAPPTSPIPFFPPIPLYQHSCLCCTLCLACILYMPLLYMPCSHSFPSQAL